MAKYIDAEKLLAEIDRRILQEQGFEDGDAEYGYKCALKDIKRFITSLQQEKDVDLEKEIEWEWVHREKQEVDLIECAEMDKETFVRFATHFYELGQKDAANKYDEIEYNRQRAEEESLGKTLDEAAHQYAWNKQEHHIDFDGDEYLDYGPRYDAFKAGAKWMAGQGVSWEDEMTYYDGFLLYGKDERAFTMEGNFNEGDKVIVQIRKKEESK